MLVIDVRQALLYFGRHKTNFMEDKNNTYISDTGNRGDIVFENLQKRFRENYGQIFSDDMAQKTVVIVPSLSLDGEILQAIKGLIHYEERMLCMLMLLRMPHTHVVYITSIPVDNTIVDYYLHLLPGITTYHARQRLTLLSCYDASRKNLTIKILERPRLIQRIREHIKNPLLSHLSCFNVTEIEKQLAVALDLPIYGCDPSLLHLGTKSSSRKLFKKLCIPLPAGTEDLRDEIGIAIALAKLKTNNPGLQKAVVKIDDGFSGDGNAVFSFSGFSATDTQLATTILEQLPQHLLMVASDVPYAHFMQKFCSIGGIVEEFIEAPIKCSPSVQCRINPLGITDIISTHDQVLDNDSGQVFLGAYFPATNAYSREIALMSKIITDELQKMGVLGRFGVDFLSVKEATGWKHYAIEINLRKGGTTHPFLMLQFLTDGMYDWEEGIYKMPNGKSRCYFASDNVVSEKFKGLTPHDLIDIAMCNKLLYDGARQTGVMFHMIGALSQYGKLGMVCIGETLKEANSYYIKTVEVLTDAGKF
jgi:PGM1 C-terminal domain